LWVTGEQLVLASNPVFFLSHMDLTPKCNPGIHGVSCNNTVSRSGFDKAYLSEAEELARNGLTLNSPGLNLKPTNFYNLKRP
jgi:hypothetical protein